MSSEKIPTDPGAVEPTAVEPAAGDAPADFESSGTPRERELAAMVVQLEAVAGARAREASEVREAYMRLLADFDTYKRRIEREREHARRLVIKQVVEQILPVADDVERALDASSASDAGQLSAGLEMIMKGLRDILARQGLVEIEALGAPFDPGKHEAILQQMRPELPENTVACVIQRGYRLGEVLIRPARVIVAVGGSRWPESQASDSKEGASA